MPSNTTAWAAAVGLRTLTCSQLARTRQGAPMKAGLCASAWTARSCRAMHACLGHMGLWRLPGLLVLGPCQLAGQAHLAPFHFFFSFLGFFFGLFLGFLVLGHLL